METGRPTVYGTLASADYVIYGLMLLISLLIGIFHIIKDKQPLNGTDEHLTARRNTMSLHFGVYSPTIIVEQQPDIGHKSMFFSVTGIQHNRNHGEKMIRDYEGHELAKSYDKMRPDYPEQIRDVVLECLQRNYRLGARERYMLDVGCGGGKATQLFTNDFERITGIDISESQISEARRNLNNRNNVRFQVVDDYRFPVESTSVDVVLCAAALHYMNLHLFLKECDRVLVQGGIVAILMYAPQLLKTSSGRIIGDVFSKTSKYHKAVDRFFQNCGTDQAVRKHSLNRYESIFNRIANPTKRWEAEIQVEYEYTMQEFLGFYATCGGYREMRYRNSYQDPLHDLRESFYEIFRENGIACEDNTSFYVTFVYPIMIVDKMGGLKIK